MTSHKRRIAAILGPTNTGKTHFALDRMLSYRTGVFGLPLRLLAREVYDRLVGLRGPSVVALVTGEERIVPPQAKYWICTVEAMPQGIGADFVAIDEIQLCADPERGHVFTDRLLHMRGQKETLFLGAETVRTMIAKLVPEATFERRERFSTLTYAGARKVSRLRPRTAIVGFSADNIYAMAELLRRQKGGAAVVMGALSPRTRNAQVALYQEGEVEYLVATDAIGMGLNLDIDHVAFASTSKFDGRRFRPLFPEEMGQIAGRAGRYLNSGTFGVTAEASPLSAEMAEAIEEHHFAPLRALNWRNTQLEFGSTKKLIASLEEGSGSHLLIRAREASDLSALRILEEDREIRDKVAVPQDVKRLWDVCQIPDFRDITPSAHAQLLGRIFTFLQNGENVPEDWLAGKIKEIDRTDGGIDALSKRLAFIRTWTYVAQRSGWVENETYWQETTRLVEDRLSDALHGALTKRFIDRRTSVLMRRLKQKEALVAEVSANGEVNVEGQFVGRLQAFRFQVDEKARVDEAKMLRSAAYQALTPHYLLQAERLYSAPDTVFDITEQGGLMWGDASVGKLVRGKDALSPEVAVFVDEEAGNEVADKVQRRLEHFVKRQIDKLFEPLIAMRDDETLAGMARGLAFRLVESLGVIPRSVVAEDVRNLDQDQRATLRKHGVRFGQFTLFMPLMLKPAATRLRLILWSLFEGMEDFPAAQPPGLVTVPSNDSQPKGYYTKAGYRLAGERAIRIDMLERLADQLRQVDGQQGFEATADMLSITGTTLEQFAGLLGGLGYSAERGEREKVRSEPQPEEAASPSEPAEPEAEKNDAAEGTTDAVEKPVVTDIETTGEADAPKEPEIEVFYIFKREQRRPAQGQNKAAKARQNKQVKGAKGKSQAPRKAKAGPRRETRIDPDSPFAALAALKK